MIIKTFNKGDVIFKEGDEGDALYEILDGRVRIYVDYDKPSQKLLVELESGRLFGEMALLEKLPRSATAIAVDKCRCRRVTEDTFFEFVEMRPQTAVAIMKNLSKRLRGLTIDYTEACRSIALLDEAEKQGKPKSKGLIASLKRFADYYNESVKTYDEMQEQLPPELRVMYNPQSLI